MDLKDSLVTRCFTQDELMFPSPLGVMDLKDSAKNKFDGLGNAQVSVPVRGNGFESEELQELNNDFHVKKFPSPLGVMDLKGWENQFHGEEYAEEFPSPLGVMDLKVGQLVIDFDEYDRLFPSPLGVMDLKAKRYDGIKTAQEF